MLYCIRGVCAETQPLITLNDYTMNTSLVQGMKERNYIRPYGMNNIHKTQNKETENESCYNFTLLNTVVLNFTETFTWVHSSTNTGYVVINTVQ